MAPHIETVQVGERRAGGAGAGSGSQASLKRILEMDAHTCMSSTAMYKAVNMKNMQAAEPQVCFSSSNISLRARQTQHCVSAERPEVWATQGSEVARLPSGQLVDVDLQRVMVLERHLLLTRLPLVLADDAVLVRVEGLKELEAAQPSHAKMSVDAQPQRRAWVKRGAELRGQRRTSSGLITPSMSPISCAASSLAFIRASRSPPRAVCSASR